MASQSPIWERAERDLVFTDERGSRDAWLWEHSRRVARSTRHIATLPGVPARRIDAGALEAAALYHDAGWVCQFREGAVDRFDILRQPTSDQQRELAAVLLTESLGDLLKPRSLETAALVVRQLNDRHVRAVETRILADADNLDEMGALDLWNTIRRHAVEGQGIEAILQSWRTRREFGYWKARIDTSIRFDAVKRVAIKRVEQLDHFMELLARSHAGDDLTELLEQIVPQPQ